MSKSTIDDTGLIRCWKLPDCLELYDGNGENQIQRHSHVSLVGHCQQLRREGVEPFQPKQGKNCRCNALQLCYAE